MAARHNITLSVESDLLKSARVIAARRGLSVSSMLAGELRELVAEDAAYESAHTKAQALLDSAFDFGGARMKDRSALHERHRVR